jgi:hypothetical protein
MARDYRQLLKSEGVWVPRWVVRLVIGAIAIWAALRIFVPPSWVVQRLDSPDGKRSAQLLRTQYLRENFVVHVKEGLLWHTAFYSPPITNDYRVDLGERLAWSPDSARLYLRIGGRPVWGQDFLQGRDLHADELEAGAVFFQSLEKTP